MAPEARHGPPSLPGLGSAPAALQPRPEDLGTHSLFLCARLACSPTHSAGHISFSPTQALGRGLPALFMDGVGARARLAPQSARLGGGELAGGAGWCHSRPALGAGKEARGTTGPSGAPGAGSPGRVSPSSPVLFCGSRHLGVLVTGRTFRPCL